MDVEEQLIELLCGLVFSEFKNHHRPDLKKYYYLREDSLIHAVKNALTDIERVGTYSSHTGANIYKHAAYICRWIAEIKPVHVDRSYPLNLTNENDLGLSVINASFSAFCLESLLGESREMSEKLLKNLRYCFEYRIHKMDTDTLALMLEHIFEKY